MLTAPRQDWKLNEEKCHEEHVKWLKQLTVVEALELHFALHSFGFNPQDQSWSRLESAHWEEKLAIRQKLCAALAKLEKIRRERPPSKNFG